MLTFLQREGIDGIEVGTPTSDASPGKGNSGAVEMKLENWCRERTFEKGGSLLDREDKFGLVSRVVVEGAGNFVSAADKEGKKSEGGGGRSSGDRTLEGGTPSLFGGETKREGTFGTSTSSKGFVNDEMEGFEERRGQDGSAVSDGFEE